MNIDLFIQNNLNVLVGVALLLALVSVATVLFLLLEIRRLKKPFRDMAELHSDLGTEKTLEKLLKGVDENREFIRGQAEELKLIIEKLTSCYNGMGIVKYNAFEDIGGMQSYSLCILTGAKNGVILTNLVGRNSTRGYALEVKDGNPSRDLSDEEREALDYALRSISI